ncbi:hypothetical protein KJ713_03740 [Patescibacteria group bacterium]|nr:hypothetical protein [Patescibacteria group bacterium]
MIAKKEKLDAEIKSYSRYYKNRMFIFVLANLLVLLIIFSALYILGYKTFSQIDQEFDLKNNLVALLIGLIILALDVILTIKFIYWPWTKIGTLRNEFYKNDPNYQKQKNKGLLIFFGVMILFVALMRYLDTRGLFNYILTWVIFFLLGLITMIIGKKYKM